VKDPVVVNPTDPVPLKSKELAAKLEELALPKKEPVKDPLNPPVEVTDPENIAGPMFTKVPEPETIKLPVTIIEDPLTTKLLLPVIELLVLKYAN
jgi:hypothetical protein